MLGDNIQVIDETLTGIDLLERVSAGYQARGLRLPHVPDRFVPAMQQLDSEFFYGSAASLPLPLDFIPAWLRAVVAPDSDEQQRLVIQDYLYFGEAGYGVNSYFYYYYLHLGPVYLFYRHPYGGIYQDNEGAADAINADQEIIARACAQPAGQPARQDGALAIIADGKSNRYGWGNMTPDGLENWQDDALEDALNELAAP